MTRPQRPLAPTYCLDGTPTKTLFDPQGYTAQQVRDRHRAVVIGHGYLTIAQHIEGETK